MTEAAAWSGTTCSRCYARAYKQRPGRREKRLAYERKYGKRPEVLERRREAQKRAKTKPEFIERMASYNARAEVREQKSLKGRARKYGISVDDVRELLARNRCDLCSRELRSGKGSGLCAHIDHDHATGRIRGVLCGDCNTAIGKLGDSIEGLQRALAYLTRAERGVISLT